MAQLEQLTDATGTFYRQWINDWYGLVLFSDRPSWQQINPLHLAAGTHAARLLTGLHKADSALAASLASLTPNATGTPAWHLAHARDNAWHTIASLVKLAVDLSCAELPTGALRNARPTVVTCHAISATPYPAISSRTGRSRHLRFTAAAARHMISELQARGRGDGEFCGPTGQDIQLRIGTANLAFEPDRDHLYAIASPGADTVIWQETKPT